ncbi:hypothetical protein [Ectothiorhodospira marina]|uniref:Capsule polysaccharide biosynthesis protein n=1 Tax=Ectothiorhodospira marina TaxID=1396821 RepID=A0A1H7RTL8_9GAMM|nr:hypothetical protein [Ectothiorhodospira marina]SEL63124.1 Capsule polysaccharide biosynthesis protein [Ectothiorhodospira marina]
MKKRVMLWAPEECDELISELHRNGVEIVCVLQGKSGLVPFYTLNDIENYHVTSCEVLNYFSDSNSCAAYKQYVECISRISNYPGTTSVNTTDISPLASDELYDKFRLDSARVAALLKSYTPDEVWFLRPPHLAFDNLLEKWCHETSVPLWIFQQSLFPAKFFYYKKALDITARALPLKFSEFKPESDGTKPNLFYMKAAKDPVFEAVIRRTLSRDWLGWSFNGVKQKSFRSIRGKGWSTFLYWWEILDDRLRPVASMRKRRRVERGKDIKSRVRYFSGEHRNAKYVYFPLHLQPEATTSYLGGVWSNQVDAIIELSRRLPKDWIVLIKENPKQGYMYRSSWFYERLLLQANVYWVPLDEPSDKLIEHAQVVATVTGTAGYEAILSGRPCIYFGHAWYGGLPGANKYTSGIDVKEVADNSISHDALLRGLSEKMNSAADGVIYKSYYEILPEEVRSGVVKQTARSLSRITHTEVVQL